MLPLHHGSRFFHFNRRYRAFCSAGAIGVSTNRRGCFQRIRHVPKQPLNFAKILTRGGRGLLGFAPRDRSPLGGTRWAERRARGGTPRGGPGGSLGRRAHPGQAARPRAGGAAPGSGYTPDRRAAPAVTLRRPRAAPQAAFAWTAATGDPRWPWRRGRANPRARAARRPQAPTRPGRGRPPRAAAPAVPGGGRGGPRLPGHRTGGPWRRGPFRQRRCASAAPARPGGLRLVYSWGPKSYTPGARYLRDNSPAAGFSPGGAGFFPGGVRLFGAAARRKAAFLPI